MALLTRDITTRFVARQEKGVDLVALLQYFRCMLFRLQVDYKEPGARWVVTTLFRHYKRLNISDAVVLFDLMMSQRLPMGTNTRQQFDQYFLDQKESTSVQLVFQYL